MSANEATFPIATMARVLGVSEAGYHAWRKRPPSKRQEADTTLLKRVRTIHASSRETYGAPRVHADLRTEGEKHGRKRIACLMRTAGLVGASRRRAGVTTTRRDRGARPTPDLVDRKFAADKPNRSWVADITFVPTASGFLYLAVVLDATAAPRAKRRQKSSRRRRESGSSGAENAFQPSAAAASAQFPPCAHRPQTGGSHEVRQSFPSKLPPRRRPARRLQHRHQVGFRDRLRAECAGKPAIKEKRLNGVIGGAAVRRCRNHAAPETQAMITAANSNAHRMYVTSCCGLRPSGLGTNSRNSGSIQAVPGRRGANTIARK